MQCFHGASAYIPECCSAWRTGRTFQKQLHFLCSRVLGTEKRAQWQTKLLEAVALLAAKILLTLSEGREKDVT